MAEGQVEAITAGTEELKMTGAGVKEGDTKLQEASKTFTLGKTIVYPVLMHCFAHCPQIVHKLVHESVPNPETTFQNYLVTALFPRTKSKYQMCPVAIIPSNGEELQDLKTVLKNGKEVYLQELLDYYQVRLNEFKELRFAPVQNIFSQSAIGTTQHASTERSPAVPPEAAHKPAVQPLPVLIQLLKEVILVAKELCQKFVQDITKNNKGLMARYRIFWNDFFLCSLEMSQHLEVVNDAMNVASDRLLPKMEKRVPQFSVWRALVGVFRGFCYQPLRALLYGQLMACVKQISLNHLQQHTATLQTSDLETFLMAPEMTNEDDLAAEDEDAKACGGAWDAEESFIVKLQLARSIFQAIMDMNLNEITVHYVNSKDLVMKVCSDFVDPLSTLITELVAQSASIFGRTPKQREVLTQLADLFRYIFPPCMWDDIDAARLRALLAGHKADIAVIAKGFTQLPKEEQKKYASGMAADTKDALIVPTIQALKNEAGKQYFGGNEAKLFVLYLKKEHIDVYTNFMETTTALNTALKKEHRVEDIEIAIKNKCLNILIDDESNLLFKMGGMTLSEAKKIHP